MFLGLDFIQRTLRHPEENLRHAQVRVQRIDRLTDKFIRLEIHHVSGLRVNLLPEFLELLGIVLALVQAQFHIVLAGIFGLNRIGIVKRIKNATNACRIRSNFFAKA